MVPILYTLLFAGSLAAINPWGVDISFADTGRTATWTHPKIFFVAAITLTNLVQARCNDRDRQGAIDFDFFRIFIFLWLGYLTSSALSTLLSPFPLHSLLGQSVMGDGLLYWLLIAVFSCSNIWVIRAKPELFQSQLHGILIGGFIVALSIFPQLFDWRIDYTIVTGQVSSFDAQLLESSIWKMQMPIGLYSNRGHAAFVLASVLSLYLVAGWKRWFPYVWTISAGLIISIALLATNTRTGIMAFLVGAMYWLLNLSYKKYGFWIHQFHKKKLIFSIITVAIGSTLVYGTYYLASTIENFDAFKFLDTNTTGRFYLWSLALIGIKHRPWFGWGFNGFGISHLFTGDWENTLNSYIPDGSSVAQVLSINEATFDFLADDNLVYTGSLLSHKAHNLFLDTLLSVGICGLIFQAGLFLFCFCCLRKSQYRILSMLAIVYLTFTQMWFESAQFSHLPWWALSLGIVPNDDERG